MSVTHMTPEPVVPVGAGIERAVAGAIVVAPELLDAPLVAEIFAVEDLGDPQARALAAAVVNLRAAGAPVDELAVRSAIAERFGHSDQPWLGVVVEMARSNPPPLERFVGWVQTIARLARAREVIAPSSFDFAEYAAEEAEIDARALDDAQPDEHPFRAPAPAPSREAAKPEAPAAPAPPPYIRGPALAGKIWSRRADPWIALVLGPETIVRARVGATIVLIGGSGSGKTSLAGNFGLQHARDVGPCIVLSIELPDDEFGARLVGTSCDASWEDALTGKVPLHHMEQALNLPRLYVLDRRRATIENLERTVRDAKEEYPGQPILVIVDYAQLLDSKEREIRMRVADAFAQIDDCAREHKFVAIALSQMSRVSQTKAASGDSDTLGKGGASLGAETAAIERFATITFTIGLSSVLDDGTELVEVSVGKARMGKGDRVLKMRYEGRSGRWRFTGESKTAAEVREERGAEKERKQRETIEHALLGVAAAATKPLTRAELIDLVAGGTKKVRQSALVRLLSQGLLVEVDKRQIRSRYFYVWTPDRAAAAGIKLRAESDGGDR